MKKITEADLLRLKFKKSELEGNLLDFIGVDEEYEEYHYFTYGNENDTTLITINDDDGSNGYLVEFYGLSEVRISGLEDLEALVDILKRNLNNE